MTKPEEKQTDIFNTGHVKSDLKGHSIRGGAATVSAQGFKFILNLVSIAVLARLLTPQDFGVIAMVTAITNFVMMFKDMGLSTATIQKDEINHAQISTLFWINTAIGVTLAVLTAVFAPVIAWFYGEPRLTLIAIVLGGIFIFSGLTIQHQALLRRRMCFFKLGIIEVLGMLVGVAVALLTAWFGAGYWSLVFMKLSAAGAIAFGVWVASGWRPGLPSRAAGTMSMLTFGRNIIGFRVINYFARNSDKILVGRFCGSGTLGLYSRAYSLLMLPISQLRGPLTSVAVPALSRIQDDPKMYRNYYAKLILLLSFISMPLVVFLAVCSKNLIVFLLGEQWIEASSFFRILAITAFIQPLWSTVGLVLISTGQSARLLKFGIFNSLLVVTSFLIGIQWGAIGVAIAYAVATYLSLFPSLWYCFRFTPISIPLFLKAIARPAIGSLAMALAMLLSYSFLAEQINIVVICVNFLIGFCVYLLVCYLLPGGRKMFRDFYEYILLIFAKKRKAAVQID